MIFFFFFVGCFTYLCIVLGRWTQNLTGRSPTLCSACTDTERLENRTAMVRILYSLSNVKKTAASSKAAAIFLGGVGGGVKKIVNII